MKLLRPMDLVYLRCPGCGAPSFTVDELLNPVYVDRVVEVAAALTRDGRAFEQRCAACRQKILQGVPVTAH
jgi:DNA-directed RNA polymerase subunit RPC12/RpoP